jgi:hypothetical protein
MMKGLVVLTFLVCEGRCVCPGLNTTPMFFCFKSVEQDFRQCEMRTFPPNLHRKRHEGMVYHLMA